jgi:hypothetical protein
MLPVLATPMLPLRAGLGALFAAVAVLFAACGTDASGVDSCRRIEQARCRKAPACPDLAVTSVEACSAFARDRCLHGLAVGDPGVARVDQCVKAIDEAISCNVVATPELDPACSFLSPDSNDAAADANSNDAGTDADANGSDADATLNSNDAGDSAAAPSDATTNNDASAPAVDADAALTARDAGESGAISVDASSGDAALESGSPLDGSAG